MVTSSSKMEALAAKSVILSLAAEHQLVMNSVTTDRSSDLRAMIRDIKDDLPEDYPDIIHQFDVWHWIKAVQKDLWAAEKLTSCAGLSAWIPSITNMMWWSFSSSKGNLKMLREKLDSITEHMCGVHHFPENSEHKLCAHGPVDDRRRALLSPDSLVYFIMIDF